MNQYIRITRKPYEEPYNLNLKIQASNSSARVEMDFYIGAQVLTEFANALEQFPKYKNQVFLWEAGSEVPEDRWAYYLRIRTFCLDELGHCAIQLRWNNNQNLPDRVISDFCILAEAGQVNRLGNLFRKFAKLKHSILEWNINDGKLIK